MSDPSLFWLVVLVVPVIALALYVWALVNAARNAKWVWFVLIFIFGR
jgi:hypothetical protein